MKMNEYADGTTLNHELAQQLADILVHAIKQRDRAYLVVSGGKTPIGLLETLSHLDIAWDKVCVLLTDERIVPHDSPDSNEALVRTHLLKNKAASAKIFSFHTEIEDKYSALDALSTRLLDIPTFDAVVLGMGEDGHTASLFPCSEELAQGLADDAGPIVMVTPKTAPHQRWSLTKKRLIDSYYVFLHIVGRKKLEVFHQVMLDDCALTMPIRAVLYHPGLELNVMWAAN